MASILYIFSDLKIQTGGNLMTVGSSVRYVFGKRCVGQIL